MYLQKRQLETSDIGWQYAFDYCYSMIYIYGFKMHFYTFLTIIIIIAVMI